MRLLLSIFLLSSGMLLATTPDSLKLKKWAVGFNYSPDFCYRIRYAKASEKGSSNITEKGKMGFTTGINLRYQLLDEIGIEFGLLYSTKGQKTLIDSYSWITPTEGNITVPAKTMTYSYQYLEIPLKINIHLVDARLKVFPSVGCSANIFMGKKTTATYNGNKETSTDFEQQNIPKAEVAVLAGIGISYDINNKLYVKIEPSFRTFVRPLVDYPVSGTLYSLGANTGIYLKF